MRDLDAVSKCEFFEIVRKLISPWHSGSLNQHGNDGNITPQGRVRFEAHDIALIVEASLAVGVSCVKPGAPDQRQQHTARGCLLFDSPAKVDARLNPSDIHEYRSGTERLCQVLKQSACVTFSVVTAVTDEDSRHSIVLKDFVAQAYGCGS